MMVCDELPASTSTAARADKGDMTSKTITAVVRACGGRQDRLRAMYGPLPLTKQLNPTAWNDMVTFWRLLLQQLCHDNAWETHRASRLLLPPLSQLQHALRLPSGLSPLCLHRMLVLMIDEGTLLPLTQTVNLTSTTTVFLNLAMDVARWGMSFFHHQHQHQHHQQQHHKAIEDDALKRLSKLPSSGYVMSAVGIHFDVNDGSLVLRMEMEGFANAMAVRHSGVGILTLDELRQLWTYEEYTDVDLRITIAYLMKERRVVTAWIDGILVVKFAGVDSSVVNAITEGERRQLEIRIAIHRITRSKERVEIAVEKYHKDTLTLLSANRRHAALASLKLQHVYEQHVGVFNQHLLKLHSVEAAIEAAETNADVLNVYANAASTLKNINAKTSLNYESVVDDLSDAMNDAASLQDAVDAANHVVSQQHGYVGIHDIDTATLEQELEVLMAEEGKHDDGDVVGDAVGDGDVDVLANVMGDLSVTVKTPSTDVDAADVEQIQRILDTSPAVQIESPKLKEKKKLTTQPHLLAPL